MAHERPRADGLLAAEAEASDGAEDARELLIAELARVRRLPAEQQGDKDLWAARLASAIPGDVVARAEWRNGAFDRDAAARGARIGLMLEGDETITWRGGEANFCRRPEESLLSLGEDGVFAGWQEQARHLEASVTFTSEGWPQRGGVDMTLADLWVLPPAVQLECRGRMQIDEMVEDDMCG